MRSLVRSPRGRLVLLALLAVAVAACGDGSERNTTTPTPTATEAAPRPTATATAAVASVREIDFTSHATLAPLIDYFGGGQIDPARIQYLDVTGDGREEAFVVVESGGTAGDLGAALLGVEDGEAVVFDYIPTGGRVELRFPEVDGGLVVTTEGVWEPRDAECCPSRLRETTYEWDGEGFAVRDEQIIDNPDVE